VQAQERGTFALRHLLPISPEGDPSALEDCRKRGYQVAWRWSIAAAWRRRWCADRFAGPHTPETAIGKGWTAVSFRTNTLEIAPKRSPAR